MQRKDLRRRRGMYASSGATPILSEDFRAVRTFRLTILRSPGCASLRAMRNLHFVKSGGKALDIVARHRRVSLTGKLNEPCRQVEFTRLLILFDHIGRVLAWVGVDLSRKRTLRSRSRTVQSDRRVENAIIGWDEPILVTGASGFIGTRVVRTLLEYGFRDVGCFVRSARGAGSLESSASGFGNSVRVRIIKWNPLAPSDCLTAAKDAAVVYHLAAGTGEKSVSRCVHEFRGHDAEFADACVREHAIKRFVSISSFAVYSNRDKKRGRVLDETAPIEERPQLRGEAYCYAKVARINLSKCSGPNMAFRTC